MLVADADAGSRLIALEYNGIVGLTRMPHSSQWGSRHSLAVRADGS